VLITGNATLDVLTAAIHQSHIHCFFLKSLQTNELVETLTQLYDKARGRQRAAEQTDEIKGDELLGAALGGAGALGLSLRHAGRPQRGAGLSA